MQPGRECGSRVAVEILVEILTTSRNENRIGEEEGARRLADGGEEEESSVDEGRGRHDQEGQKSPKIWGRDTFVNPDAVMILAYDVTLAYLTVPEMKGLSC